MSAEKEGGCWRRKRGVALQRHVAREWRRGQRQTCWLLRGGEKTSALKRVCSLQLRSLLLLFFLLPESHPPYFHTVLLRVKEQHASSFVEEKTSVTGEEADHRGDKGADTDWLTNCACSREGTSDVSEQQGTRGGFLEFLLHCFHSILPFLSILFAIQCHLLLLPSAVLECEWNSPNADDMSAINSRKESCTQGVHAHCKPCRPCLSCSASAPSPKGSNRMKGQEVACRTESEDY